MLRDLFIKDIGWKLFSLFLAAVIWFTVNRILHESMLPQTDSTLRTVTYDNLPVAAVSTFADVRSYHLAPVTVKVTISGPDVAVKTLQADQLHATVNVGINNLSRSQMLPVDISLPSQVAVVDIEPDKVLVTQPAPVDKKP